MSYTIQYWQWQYCVKANLGVRVDAFHASRSWLQDTLQRKLVDFAWNRRFFYLPGACLPFLGYTWLKVGINRIFLIRSACFYQSSGQPRVNPGKQEQGGAKKSKKTASYLFEVSCSQRRVIAAQIGRNSTGERPHPTWAIRAAKIPNPESRFCSAHFMNPSTCI